MADYPLELPATDRYRSATMRAIDTVSEARSPYTGQRQTIVYPAQWWETDITLVSMRTADKEAWASWLLSLRGISGSFLLGDPARSGPRGAARTTPGAPLVRGGDQTGDLLAIDGAPVGVVGWLKAGDYFQLGSGATARLHKLTQDADTDVNGWASLVFWPDLRESPADNAALVLDAPRGVFARVDNQAEWSTEVGDVSTITFGVREVLT